MKPFELDIVTAGTVRRSLVAADDIEGDIKFQNDINCLLAQMDEKVPPLSAIGIMMSQPRDTRARGKQRRAVAQRVLRVLDGGGGVSEALRQAAAASGTAHTPALTPTPTPAMTPVNEAADGPDGKKLVQWPSAARQGQR